MKPTLAFKPNPVSVVKPAFLFRVYVVCSFFYLVLGNTARFLSVGSFNNNLLITEFFLYTATLTLLILHSRLLAKLLTSLGFLFLFIVLSFFLGVLKSGFELVPLLYAIRLILLLSSSFVLGYCLYHLRSQLTTTLGWFSNVYLALAIFGLAIYIAFPNSYELWQFLKTYGVEVNGDPHVRRFISSYFDPNYYGAIASLGVITSLLCYHYRQQLRYLFIALFITLSILLSSSRSGIATFLAVILLILFQVSKHLLSKKNISRRLVLLFPILVAGAIMLAPVYLESILKVWQRTVKLDASAQVRFNSFTIGQELFSSAPIFGLGYNYLALYAEKLRGQVSSVDSSLQGTLINFGLIGTFLLAAYIASFFINLYKKLNQQPPTVQPQIRLTLWYLNSYVIVIVLFTSQFNNILYYQFWLFPVVALYSYFWFIQEKSPR
jgi:O-antigen ligase